MRDDSLRRINTLLSEALSAINTSRWDVAENKCKKILAIHPNQIDAAYLLASIYESVGNNDLAINYYEKVLYLSPCHVDALNNLGTIHESTGNTANALSYYSKAATCSPSHFIANYNLGRLSRATGDLDTAIKSLKAALDTNKESTATLMELGLTLKGLGDASMALQYLLKAREVCPDNPVVYNLLGNIYQLKGDMKLAISSYQTAIRHKTDFASAYNNLGSTYLAMGNVTSALDNYRKAVQLAPGWNGAASNMLLAVNYVSDSQEYLFYQHAQWGRLLKPSSRPEQRNLKILKDRRIRIGYVSPDFRAHSVAWFLLAILTNYDRNLFHVTCFSDTASKDHVTNEIMSLVDDWHNIVGLPDDEVCKRISACKIDLLVDLAGHTANNRLGVFAMQAAPVQASYLGYPNTTGLETIKYRFTDRVADPPGGSDALHTEVLVRLPGCFLCYTPFKGSPECTSAPVETNKYITFGSFNVLAKISDGCIETWSKILKQVKDSRLVLKSAGLEDPVTRDYISQKFMQHDIDENRLEIIPRTVDIRSHLEQYNHVDISLDTFPYNGTTTTCESLWMGVPVISLKGNRHAGRVSASLLTHLELSELVTDHTEQYIAVAKRLAEDQKQINLYRGSLRSRMTGSPLCDGPGFTRSLEQAFLKMVQ